MIAEIIEDWTTKNNVLAIEPFKLSQTGPQALKSSFVGIVQAADCDTPVIPLNELTTMM